MTDTLTIPTAISDLFFNRDHSDAVLTDKGKFAGYNDNILTESAELMNGCLRDLGVDTPPASAIVADFYGRL